MKKYVTLFILLFVLFAADVSAQNQRIVFSDASVRRGDEAGWKTRDYDEKNWQVIQLNRDWDSQGHGDYDGTAFYRKRFHLPSSMLEQSYWKDSLLLYMGKIDDADEVYLNGKMVGKTGRFPGDPGGYESAAKTDRSYRIAANDPTIVWDGENVIAVRVYDGGGLGGMIGGGFPHIRMVDLIDELSVGTSFAKTSNGNECVVSLSNGHDMRVNGNLNIEVIDTESDAVVKSFSRKVKLGARAVITKAVPYFSGKRHRIKITFTEEKTRLTLTESVIAPYILTPKAPDTPRINGVKVFGLRPGSPFFFRIPASGLRPMRYSVENLPEGLTLDAGTGLITGSLSEPGEYEMTFVAQNAKGKDERGFTLKVGDALCLTPPMGWNSWNCWGITVSDEKVRSSAQALLDKGLADFGWNYINVDDAWQNGSRDADGTLHGNDSFPDMAALGDWLHSQGLRFGIYSSPGPLTCGKYLGSYGHEKQDADTWASWGVDYLKHDWCGYSAIYHKANDHSLSARMKPYMQMDNALKSQNRDIVYSLCQYGSREVWQWGVAAGGHLWRTTHDIVDTWDSFRHIGFDRQAGLSPFAGPGHWNDPDMLVVGKLGWGHQLRDSRLTYDEQYTHISLWCLLASPLLLGCDLSQLDDFTLNLLTNAEVIAVNQDPLGRQAERFVNDGDRQVWVKPMEDGSHAVGIFNLGAEDCETELRWSELKLPDSVKVRDLWRQKDLGESNVSFKIKIASHGVALLKIQ